MKLKLFSVIVLALVLSACGNKQNESQPAAVKVDVPKLYQNFCISCHGNQLQGGQGPNIQKVGERLDEAEIIKRIQKGGGGMPPFQVTMKEEELKALASWLAGLK
ncbi:c-type cytochrome [Paenibacillus sp. LMG 31458]|uniref:C-type cytochrome n=2 Tax=Paenibacillus TaxID=44249 RepID=A0ABX1Z1X6_9BACL|nr:MULTISPECIES: cytochrome c [Paenibacillus]NOU75991.1 c-type cytochrome [Paenibacillus phytorum]NOU86394.1 c-type cytochrome [Paenibacillus germinis]